MIEIWPNQVTFPEVNNIQGHYVRRHDSAKSRQKHSPSTQSLPSTSKLDTNPGHYVRRHDSAKSREKVSVTGQSLSHDVSRQTFPPVKVQPKLTLLWAAFFSIIKKVAAFGRLTGSGCILNTRTERSDRKSL